MRPIPRSDYPLGTMGMFDSQPGVDAAIVPVTPVVDAAPARWLRISILCDGRSVVQVSFPAYAVLNLADLVPDEVRAHVASREVDLAQLAAHVAARGCPPRRWRRAGSWPPGTGAGSRRG